MYNYQAMENAGEFIKSHNDKEGVRLNKYLSDCGVCSRRQADKAIEEGRVYVNGRTAVLGTRIFAGDLVEYEGKTLSPQEDLVLIAFNKPVGIECTTDENNPDNIVSFINFKSRIYPIGRLDKNSSGLILLTNTGELSDKILRGSNYHEKEYEVKVDKPVSDIFLKKMAAGVPVLDTVTRPCEVKKTGKYSFNIILTQGLNRQIRRMCGYLGYNVIRLKRIRIMNIRLGNLETGKYRNVTETELKELLKGLYDE